MDNATKPDTMREYAEKVLAENQVADNGKVMTKITLDKIIGKIKQDMIPNEGEDTKWLVNITGQLDSYETGETAFGPYMLLKGDFIVENFADGKDYPGPSIILPSVCEYPIKQHMGAVGFVSGTSAPIVFEMDIGVDYLKGEVIEIDGKAATHKKYRWAVRPVGVQPQSALRLLRGQMRAHREQLRLAGGAAKPVPMIDSEKGPAPDPIAEKHAKK